MDEDNKLYELLNVSRTASDAEIKKVSIHKEHVLDLGWIHFKRELTTWNISTSFRAIVS